ncbi:flagellar biosynthesis anti-sigma factor FlgM [Acetonema longum]|uniref:Negative regulator of flagellin synthesis n=1 Tax=Acetonema longum DSM 6540 TaxID=1009370 RepID=F7NNU2_9FIRM|nr:flagellar biosynthesis anti-sigma factor FlgM [Acetonema longum]EGO62276.1 anti-sigma-28 factor, FlgM [Acetonema longum DSM 6540]
MIISGKQVQDVLKVYTEQTSGKTKSPGRSNPVSGKRDEVVLSSKAHEFGSVLQALQALPEVRPERVKEISAKIADGKYQVSAEQIADKMIGRSIIDRIV